MYKKILDSNGQIIGVLDNEKNQQIPLDELNADYIKLLEANVEVENLEEHNPKSINDKIDILRQYLYQYIDRIAKEKGYLSGTDLMTYKVSAFTPFKTDADAFSLWRDAVFTYALGEIQKIKNETRTMPTLQEFIQELPVITWP